MPSTKRIPLKHSTTNRAVTAASLVLLVLVFLVLWPGQLVQSTPEKTAANRTARLLLVEKTTAALERAVDHLFDVGDGVNLDAVLGLRLVEDQLRAFRLHVVEPYVSLVKDGDLASLIDELSRVHNKTSDYRQKLTKIVQRNQPRYFHYMSFVITGGNWDLWYPQRSVDRSSMPTYGFEKTVDEALRGPDSDECLMESYFKQCQFTKKCWDRMAYSFMNGYSLTHEIFFIMVSIALGCGKEVEKSSLKWKNITSDELLAREFSAVLHEAELIAITDYPLYQKDLFMEQAAFGGIFGYKDFFRDDWLEQILSWQDELGCYAVDYNATIAVFRRDFPNRTTPFINLRAMIPSLVKSGTKTRKHVAGTISQLHHRQKRTEVILEDGCWAHMTSVGMVALGQYIRYLLEPLMTQ